ncbi:MAG: hypothetical protein IJZ53_10545, partial [Tyzzerella sp.]|nr:hypothetical protein [Tyzzerella sp.]
LSEKQLEKISGNGLNLFLVYSGSNTFSLYVENDNGTDVTKVADYVSTLNNKKIYQLKHNNTGFTTNGYFLKNYTTAQDAAKNLFDILN